MIVTKYHAFAGMIFLIFMASIAMMPSDMSDNGNLENTTDEIIEPVQEMEREQTPLMSTIDDTPDEEEKDGWWKHDGHSSISYTTSSPVNSSNSEQVPENEDEGKGTQVPEEIPEFPVIAVPMMTIIGISLLFSRK
ncbi:hypothetical protein [Methanolobus profundi]|uniref:PEF-CTERM protein sorting domain-containing protein n=1 Tax=Methanolobus profundi TaxID=487685 RepID=A0A1I4U345_9EURY|nr:hypothetical protein [Methanolobus profundi]SFM83432.1 hypothetical protein SAMN04488696_2530 [Methanolobus profundi]